MKKLKLFFVAASLLLMTVGVFASKSHMFASYTVYAAANSTTYYPIQTGVTLGTVWFNDAAADITTMSNTFQTSDYLVYGNNGAGSGYIALYNKF